MCRLCVHPLLLYEKIDVPLLHDGRKTENKEIVRRSVAACLGGGGLYVLRDGGRR